MLCSYKNIFFEGNCINCSVRGTELAAHKIQYRGFHVDDLPSENISRYLDMASLYIHDAISQEGVVLVNCYMGLSRSASCVLAYLIAFQQMSLDKALEQVRRRRPVNPNEGFIKQLRDFQTRRLKIPLDRKSSRSLL